MTHLVNDSGRTMCGQVPLNGFIGKNGVTIKGDKVMSVTEYKLLKFKPNVCSSCVNEVL